MTPNNNKPPVMFSHQFQSVLLIAIFTTLVSALIMAINFSNKLATTLENHEQRISNTEKQQERFDSWREAITQNAYFRQGRTQQP